MADSVNINLGNGQVATVDVDAFRLALRVGPSGSIEGIGLLIPEQSLVQPLPAASPESPSPEPAKQGRRHARVLFPLAFFSLLLVQMLRVRSLR